MNASEGQSASSVWWTRGHFHDRLGGYDTHSASRVQTLGQFQDSVKGYDVHPASPVLGSQFHDRADGCQVRFASPV